MRQQKQQKDSNLRLYLILLIYISSQFIAEIKCSFDILRCYIFLQLHDRVKTQTTCRHIYN
jgi:hypothetical protein